MRGWASRATNLLLHLMNESFCAIAHKFMNSPDLVDDNGT